MTAPFMIIGLSVYVLVFVVGWVVGARVTLIQRGVYETDD